MSARGMAIMGWRWLSGAVLAFALAAPVMAAETAQRNFATADAAVTAMVEAIRKADRKAFLAIIGPGSGSWIFSGDAVADKAGFAKFLAAYDQKHTLVAGDGRTILNVGNDDWPFPVPLVKAGDRWRFDAAAGKTEILARRIGRNELDTIQTLKAIVDAQREYVLLDRDRDGLLEYAQKFMSSSGKHDGLYWPTKAGEPPSPLGPLVANAHAEGYSGDAPKAGVPRPYHGYFYRMLKAQGKDAPGGGYDYLAKGSMIGGFAVIATPVNYGTSGVMTFLVSHDGVVYQKNLGPDTAQVAARITRFNPDAGWARIP
ncbi:MAG: DUF2950 domain-containing protein [Burkholderiales bacterium]